MGSANFSDDVKTRYSRMASRLERTLEGLCDALYMLVVLANKFISFGFLFNIPNKTASLEELIFILHCNEILRHIKIGNEFNLKVIGQKISNPKMALYLPGVN